MSMYVHNLSTHNHLMKSAFRFSPSNLERCEAAFKREHDIAMGYGDRPIERNVRARTAWESLVDAFPAPREISCKMDRSRVVKAMKPLYDCSNEPDPRCTCYKCETAFMEQISYFQDIQTNAVINWTPPAGVYALDTKKPEIVPEQWYPCVTANHF